MAGIYVHIPFCKAKCRYCDFASYPDKLGFQESYMACVYREMAMRKEELKDMTFDTLYIGGGTPSVIEEELIAMLVVSAKKNFHLTEDAEITIEMNPGTVSAKKIDLYKKCGINRFSVGLQSAHDAQLRELGRVHTLNEFITCAKLLKGENFSVDVMVGLKNQTKQEVEQTIEVAAGFGASHISMYALTPEDGTPIYTDYLNGELPDSDQTAELYDCGVKKLQSLGYERYEVSNFSKKGKRSRHNMNYWKRGEYIGFGVSASSCIRNVRFTNSYDLDEYIKCILTNHFPVIDSQEIDFAGQKDEYIMLALRTQDGILLSEYQKLFGSSFEEEFASVLQKQANYMGKEDGRIFILPEYLFVQNEIIINFLQEE